MIHYELTVGNSFFETMRERTGEVVMVIRRAQDHIVVITKDFYPRGIYRMPTGTLRDKENPDDALGRELYEETGLRSSSPRLLETIGFKFRCDERDHGFNSYIYVTEPLAGEPQSKDPSERITDFKDVGVEELPAIIESLKSLTERWADWGLFRAVPHEVVYERLRARWGG